jgi:hypothetical protein
MKQDAVLNLSPASIASRSLNSKIMINTPVTVAPKRENVSCATEMFA